MSGNQNKARLLPYSTIEAARRGSVEATNTVVRHFESYITVLSTLRLYDEYGNPHSYVDDGLRRRLEIKLISKIPVFRGI